MASASRVGEGPMAKTDRRPPKRKVNLLRREGVTRVDWKDVTLLRKFISDRGKIRSRRVTGLTPQEQREVATAIKNAREMALLPYPGPSQR
ncbi:30S ribosomal protein S18 [Kutzneria sp. 744]|nr:30S ribosomal protein S18 [Kutzneria sp. 744]